MSWFDSARKGPQPGALKAATFHTAAVLALAALNLAICQRLFQVEFTDHFSSIEGSFIAIARYVSEHWGQYSWWPLWHCGMPYQDTYVPLLHLVVAATATLGKISAAHAYHAVTGVTYALGAVTLYLMAVRLEAPRGAALLAGVFYSLLSPSAFLMPNIAHDVGGLWYSRRLQVLTVYGEGPHVTAMTLIPLVILALEWTLARRTGRALVSAAFSIALVFLTNVPGTMALGLMVFCWISVQPSGKRAAAWIVAAGASVLAYGLACYGLPPSSIGTVMGNVGAMHSGFSNSLRYGPVWLVLVLAAAGGAGYLLSRTRLPLVVRFAALSFGLIAPLAMTAHVETFELLPQVGRLHLEMEMGVCLILGMLGWMLYSWIPRWIRPIVLALCLAPIGIQFDHYRTRAAMDIAPADLAHHSEYTTARWLNANLKGQRVYTVGSTGFWLNAFTDTPQLIGCCDQGLSMPLLNYVAYVIDSRVTDVDTEAARYWLRALGVGTLVVSGPDSTDVYKDIHSPERFDRFFTPLHRENGDTVYSVFGKPTSLAHVVQAAEVIPHRPGNRMEYAELIRYANVAANDSRTAGFEWVRGDRARIRTRLKKGDLVSVQVAWFPGWKAEVGGQRRTITGDGLGFVTIQPDCEGDCEIDLRWTGRRDLPLAAVASGAALLLSVMLLYGWKPSRVW